MSSSMPCLPRLAADLTGWMTRGMAALGLALTATGAAMAATPQIYDGPGDGAGVRLILHPQSAAQGHVELQFCDVGGTAGCGTNGKGTYSRQGGKLTLSFRNMGSTCIWSLHALPHGKLYLDQSGPLDACQPYHGASFGWDDGVTFTPAATRAAIPVTSPAGAGPSFDCAKATAPADMLVCGNADVSAMDRQVVAAYHAALHQAKTPADRQELEHAQVLWVHAKMRCRDVACLQSTYRERLQALAGAASPR